MAGYNNVEILAGAGPFPWVIVVNATGMLYYGAVSL
jgi:hypothetical protein